jgi:urocanate hydratase
MAMKIKGNELELYRRVDEVLRYIWDPIGICDEPAARDEYHSYLPSVFSMVRARKTPKEIADRLRDIEEKMMGLTAKKDRLLKVAGILLAHREKLLSRES